MAADSQFGGRFGPIKRFAAIFFLICAVVAAVLGAKGAGTMRIVLIAVAVVLLLIGIVLARTSFAALQKREF
ncbi:MAG: hypothetical protein ABI384_09220 [Allobranchiibius sp.]